MIAVLEVFTVPPFGENTYLFGDAGSGEAVVIDPGGRIEDILRVASQRQVAVRRILNTHAHIDHVLGVDALRDRTGARFGLHPQARETLLTLPQQARRFGLPEAAAPRVDDLLEPGSTLATGGLRLEVRYTPGHALGHVTFVARDVEIADGDAFPAVAFCGDVIFRGSIGRTDLDGGDHELLMGSITDQILTLPDETLLLSGHGPATTVGYERSYNPFIAEWLEQAAGGASA